MAASELKKRLLATLKISNTTLWRQCRAVIQDYGPMSIEEARLVLAHEAGIDLNRYNLTESELERIRAIRSRMGAPVDRSARPPAPATVRTTRPPERGTDTENSPAALFDSRGFHSELGKPTRRLFAGGHLTEAVRGASQRLLNRVKKLSGLDLDGQTLMSNAFAAQKPRLQMSALKTESEKDEHAGVRFLMMGTVAAFRNPCTHEDRWPAVEDATLALEALSLVSLLHRFLDRCESYRAENP